MNPNKARYVLQEVQFPVQWRLNYVTTISVRDTEACWMTNLFNLKVTKCRGHQLIVLTGSFVVTVLLGDGYGGCVTREHNAIRLDKNIWKNIWKWRLWHTYCLLLGHFLTKKKSWDYRWWLLGRSLMIGWRKILKPWKGALSSHFRVSVCLSVDGLQGTPFGLGT